MFPGLTTLFGSFVHVMRPEWDSAGDSTLHKWPELLSRQDAPQNDFSLENTFSNQPGQAEFRPVLLWTPWQFNMTPPWHLSYLDRLWQNGMKIFSDASVEMPTPVGAWLPYFYNDKKRTFFVLPSVRPAIPSTTVANGGGVRYYYPDIKKAVRDWGDFFEGFVRTWVDDFDLASLSAAERQQIYAAPPGRIPGGIDASTTRTISYGTWQRGTSCGSFDFYIGGLSLYHVPVPAIPLQESLPSVRLRLRQATSQPASGIPALMARETQLKDSGFSFLQTYQPTAWVVAACNRAVLPGRSRGLHAGRRLFALQLGALLPCSAAHREFAEPEPALRRSPRLVSLHLQSDRRGERHAGRLGR